VHLFRRRSHWNVVLDAEIFDWGNPDLWLEDNISPAKAFVLLRIGCEAAGVDRISAGRPERGEPVWPLMSDRCLNDLAIG